MRHCLAGKIRGDFKASKSGFKMLVKQFLARRYRNIFEHSMSFSATQFEDYQKKQLEKMVLHCVENVPYYRTYRDQYIKDGKVLPLSQLPVLPKALVREKNAEFHASRGVGLWQSHATSGTSGSPLVIRASYQIHAKVLVAINRHYRMFGIKPGGRVACLTGFFKPATVGSEVLFWRDYFYKRIFLSIYKLSDANIREYHEILVRFKPVSIYGYASNIFLLANGFLRHNLRAPESLKAIITSSEILYPQWREVIVKAFDVPVLDRYGSQELQCIISECPQGRMHINPEFGIVEVVDDKYQPVENGTEGNLLLTGLANNAMPLIRYAIGDRGIMDEDTSVCSCGLSWPVVKSITGRSEDAITTPDGRRLMYLNFHCTEFIKGIVESQFIQDRSDHITIRLVVNDQFKQGSEQIIQDDLRNRAQYEFEVDFEYMDSIPRGPRGKFKAVLNLT